MILTQRLVWFIPVSIGLFLIPFAVFGQATDDFTITGVVGSDTTPPTVPGNFSVTPITTSQIDVAWDASSDNVSVGGYQVFRDASQVATTSLTSYSDTGLLASTSYTYYIVAFDTSFNYATPTASIATSTLPLTPTSTPTTTPTSRGGGGGLSLVLADIEIQNLMYDTTQNVLALSFDTNVYTQAVIRWGRTTDYEGGYVASDAFRTSHNTQINNLAAGTVYELEIHLVNRTNERELTRHIQITTKPGLDSIPPPNVTDFIAWRTADTARLSWVNPNIADFSHVRVLSSDFFYPTHPADGWLVYEGDGQTIRDNRPISKNSTRYYTVFVYDDAGNISSGAVAFVSRGTPVSPHTTPQSSTTTPLFTPPLFTFDDITFIQNNRVLIGKDDVVTIGGEKNTTISISYDFLPEHLKTVVVTLEYPGDSKKVFSFLLRINPQKTTYEAQIGPLTDAGEYVTKIEVFDFNTEEIFTVRGTILVKKTALETIYDTSEKIGLMAFIQKLGFIFWLLLILLGILWYQFIASRDKLKSAQ